MFHNSFHSDSNLRGPSQKFDELVNDNKMIYFAEEAEYKIANNPDLGKIQIASLCKDGFNPDELFVKLEDEKKVPLDFK